MNVGRHVLVYDLGGGTFDLALLVRDEVDDAFRLAMAPRGERIGGEDFDRAIYDHFDAGFRKKKDQPICPDGVDLQLLRQCRRFKESMTWSEQPAPLSWSWGQTVLNLKLNRAQFESLIEKPVERTVRLTRSIQEDAATAGFDLDAVILIGGSSRTPCIVRRLQETLQVEPRRWQKQDVAVALGAAYHGQQLWGEKPSRPEPAQKKPAQPKANGDEYDVVEAPPRKEQAKPARPEVKQRPACAPGATKLVQPSSPPKNPFLMAFLSFLIIGLGQMIMGQGRKGAVMLVGTIGVVLVTGGMAAPLAPFAWILSACDALAIAKKLRGGNAVGRWEFF